MFPEEKIQFKRPDVPSLRQEGYSCVDMHFHTRFSDGSSRVETVKKRIKKRSIGVAITDHNDIRGSVKLIRSNGSLLVIPGIEVSSKEVSHYLFYFNTIRDLQHFHKHHIGKKLGIHPYASTKLATEDLLDIAEDYNCLTSVAHPFLPNSFGMLKNIRRGYVDPESMKRFDAIEALNGSLIEKMNLKAIKLAYDFGKAYTGGSDGHTIHALGRVLTCAHAENPTQFLEEIRKKKNIIVGKETKMITKPIPAARATRHQMKHFRGYASSKYNDFLKRSIKYHFSRVKKGIKSLKEKI